MIHPEYHTCDRCGKRLIEPDLGFRKIEYTLPNARPCDSSDIKLSDIIKDYITSKTDDSTEVKVRFMAGWVPREYELCYFCAKRMYKLVDKFIKNKT